MSSRLARLVVGVVVVPKAGASRARPAHVRQFFGGYVWFNVVVVVVGVCPTPSPILVIVVVCYYCYFLCLHTCPPGPLCPRTPRGA